MLPPLALAQQHVGNNGGCRVPDQHDDSPTFFVDDPHRLVQKIRPRPGRSQNVVENVDGMHTHQHRFGCRDIALHQCDVFGILDSIEIDHQLEFAAGLGLDLGFDCAMNEIVVTAPIGDEVGDSRDLEPVKLRKLNEVRQPRHRAVIVHDLADDAGRIETGKPRDIDSRLGVPRTHQNTAIPRHQRKYMAGRNDVRCAFGRVDGNGNGMGAVVRRDAGRNALTRFDGNGKGRLVPRLVGG